MFNPRHPGTLIALRPFLMSLACIALLVSAANAQDQAVIAQLRLEPLDKKRERTVPLKVYAATSGEPLPVILFSHGLGGSRENSRYLGEHWAAAGYVGVFMQHAGSDETVWKSVPLRQRMAALRAATGAQELLNRLDDVAFVIDQLHVWNNEKDHPLYQKLNLDKIGMCGHSFGAATTLGVAGRKYPRGRSFQENRITAFFAMSPQTSKRVYTAEQAFGHLTRPLLCMTGTKDGSPIDPTVKPESRREVFAALPKSDKYQLVLQDAQHSAFGDSPGKARTRDPRHHPAILTISTHFWDAYLKDDPAAKTWLQSRRPLIETRLSERTDIWEWK